MVDPNSTPSAATNNAPQHAGSLLLSPGSTSEDDDPPPIRTPPAGSAALTARPDLSLQTDPAGGDATPPPVQHADAHQTDPGASLPQEEGLFLSPAQPNDDQALHTGTTLVPTPNSSKDDDDRQDGPKAFDFALGTSGLSLDKVDSTTFSSTTTATTNASASSSRQSSVTAAGEESAQREDGLGLNGGDACISIDTLESYDGNDAHTATVQEVAGFHDVDLTQGLSPHEVKERQEKDGLNKLSGDNTVKWYTVLLRQVSNSLTLVLLLAMGVSYGMDDYVEGSVIAAVILANIAIGFVQDFRAEKTMESLHSLSAPEALVKRSGALTKTKAEELVRGDIVSIKTGDVVPADLRIFESVNLETDEALLTGESLPIAKSHGYVAKVGCDIPIGDRTNMVWASSTVTKGRALGIVVATGMSTQVGNIAGLLQGKEEKSGSYLGRFCRRSWKIVKNILGLVGTPLQIKLSKFALLLFCLAILLCIIVLSSSKFQVDDQILLYAVCTAVAVIPESLIAVLTITMAVGTKTMAKGHVIVRKMQALEAVGGVTNICSDKTGTLTQGRMVARKAFLANGDVITVGGVQDPFSPESGTVEGPTEKAGGLMTAIGMCNLATVQRADEKGWSGSGEPTEISLQVLAMRFGMGKADLLASGNWEMLAEHPFDSTVKRMTVVYRHEDRVVAYMKGAGEVIVPMLDISDGEKKVIAQHIEAMAGEGLRVLCVATKALKGEDKSFNERKTVEANMTFLGLVGLYDPPRPETAEAVRRCKQAGIKVHMLTGDHIRTATAIAHEVGILAHAVPSTIASTLIMTAGDFDMLREEEIDGMLDLPVVVARCSPATKVRMVEALHRRNAFCVMTGDGVNDSPALSRADVGIAMGLNGSDVAKDASDLVLTDDNFASIVRAVEEGRRLFDNIQKFLMHLLISNISQVVLLLIGLAFKDHYGISVFPLSPLEILWVNMVTSSFLALGLGLEEAQPDIMTRPPHDLKTGVFTWELIIDKTLYGVLMGALCLASFTIVVYGANAGNLGKECNQHYSEACSTVFRGRATVFSTISFLLLLTAWEVKHFTRSLFRFYPEKHGYGWHGLVGGLWENRFLFWAVVGGGLVTFPCVYIPGFNTIVFKHAGIGWEWGVVFGCCVVYVAVIEGWKAIKRWRRWGAAGRVAVRLDEVVETV